MAIVISRGGIANSLLTSTKDVSEKIVSESRKVKDGNRLSLQSSTSTSLKEYSSEMLTYARSTKVQESIIPAMNEVGREVDQSGDLLLSMDSMAHSVTTGLPLDNTSAMAAAAEAQGALQKIALILNEFSNVNQDAILNQSNVNPDGTFNANFITYPTPANFVELEGGKTIEGAIVPEDFVQMVGALNLILRETRTTPLPNAISQETAAAYRTGVASIAGIVEKAKINYEALDRAQENAKLEAAESKDAIEKKKNFDMAESTKILQEASKQNLVLRNYLTLLFSFQGKVIESMAAAATTVG